MEKGNKTEMNRSVLYREFKISKAWDDRYGLPTRPHHNNPHIYIAYFLLCDLIGPYKLLDTEIGDLSYCYHSFYSKCKTSDGLFNRWPDGTGGRLSHDEILGAAFCHWYFGNVDEIEKLYRELIKRDGIVNQVSDPLDSVFGDSRFDVFRILYMKPILQFFCGYSLSLRSQAMIAIHLISQIIKNDKGAGGYLRSLLILSALRNRNYSLINFVYSIFKSFMGKRGPSKIAEEYFGKNEPYYFYLPSSWW